MKHDIDSSRAGGFRPRAEANRFGAALTGAGILLVLLAIVSPAGAASRVWLGETALWSDPDNWSPNGVPQIGRAHV